MRHKDTAKKPCPEKPAQLTGSIADDEQQTPEQNFPARLPITIGPPDASWSHAKWLALADQALLD